MKVYLFFVIVLLSQETFAQQTDNPGVFIKFSSKKIKSASRFCTIYITDTGKVIQQQYMHAPNDSTFNWVRCKANVPLRIYQDGCILADEAPYPVAEIKPGKLIYAGDSIIVNMDNNISVPIVKSKKR